MIRDYVAIRRLAGAAEPQAEACGPPLALISSGGRAVWRRCAWDLMVRGEEISVINPIVMGVSSAVQALEALFASTQTGPASSSGGAFSTGQGLPTTGASAQAAPSNASNKFAPSTL